MKLSEARAEVLGRPYRILSLEDSALDAELMERQLEAAGLRFDFDRVWTREDFEACLRKDRWDVILADHVLPAFDGDTAPTLSREIAPDTPFIFVSGTLGEELAVEALRHGAKDYVVKQRLARLPSVVQRAVSEAREQRLSRDVENRLRETQRRLEAVLNNASVSVFVMDEHQRCIYMNSAAEDLTGYRLEEANGQVLHDLIHHKRPDGSHFPLAECPIDRAFPEDFQVQGEEVFVHKNGHFYPVAFTASPIHDETSRTIGTIIEVRNISAERQADEQRRAAEQQLRELNETLEGRVSEALAERKLLADIMEATDAFVQVADLDYRWLAINKASADEFERIFGVRPKVGDSMLDVLSHLPDHQAAVRAVWSRALAGEEFTEVGEFGDTGRERRYYEMKFNTLRDADGRRIGAYQFVHDVTGRLSDQARLRAIFETSNQFQALLDLEGKVLEANATSLQALPPGKQEVRGRPYWDCAWFRDSPVAAEKVHAAVEQVSATGEPFREELRLMMDGVERSFDFQLRPMQGSGGEVAAIVAEAVDTTQRRLAEEALRQSQKLESMGQLTGGVAHDFNNLLTPIMGALDLLSREDSVQPRQKRLVGGALAAAERAKTLVQRLLAFARRQPLQKQAVDLARVAQGMSDLLRSTSGPKIRLIFHAEPDLPMASADPNQLELALLNLGVNARDAMPDGGTLEIKVRTGDPIAEQIGELTREQYLVLSVSDTGQGMDDATLARAVEPFFSTKGIGKGTGLGLSMVHGLASQLDGALKLSSAVGEGTVAELWLPISSEAQEDRSAPSPVHSPQRSGRILLVDDEDLVRSAAGDMLRDMGFEVVEAGCAEEALDKIRQGLRADLLVTDHLMPGLSGPELVGEARRHQPSLPALIVSGYAEVEGLATDCLRLAKPFCQAELASSVNAALDLATSDHESSAES